MRRNPLYIFQDLTSVGIFSVPLKSTVHIVDAGNGYPMFIQLVAKTGLEEYSTIENLLDIPSNYIDINASGSSISQLEHIIENGMAGWRILGREPDNYDDIGSEAIDFSESTVLDSVNGASGANSFATGLNVISSGLNSFVAGDLSIAFGKNSFATGESTYANAKNTSTFGHGTKISNESAMAIGRYNLIQPATETNKTIFEIGVGNSSIDTANALSVYLDGLILAPELTKDMIDANLQALTTKEYVDYAVKTTSGHLQKITEGGKEGYRIRDRDANNFGDTGAEAVDLSSTDSNASLTIGATGAGSLATGFRVTASGNYSHAGGSGTQASGHYSTSSGLTTLAGGEAAHAEGRETEATGTRAHAEGYTTKAQGSESHAEGNTTIASGLQSHAEGSTTIASGDQSHAEGYSTLAQGKQSHAEGLETAALGSHSHTEGYGTRISTPNGHAGGQYNVGTNQEIIFEVGVGIKDNDRKNALEVYVGNSINNANRGIVKAPLLTNAIIDSAAAGPQCLVTRDYLMNNSNVSQLERIDRVTNPGCEIGAAGIITNVGWRIIGRDSNNYQEIGCGAIDFSYSNVPNKGAAGNYSMAEGINALTIGAQSHAAGMYTIAKADNQFVVGQYNTVVDDCMFVVGVGTGDAALTRKNALEVTNAGLVLAPVMETTDIDAASDKCLVTKEYLLQGTGPVPVRENFDVTAAMIPAPPTTTVEIPLLNLVVSALPVDVWLNGVKLRENEFNVGPVSATASAIYLNSATANDWIEVGYYK